MIIRNSARFSDRWTDAAKSAWRTACRDAGMTNAWTYTPPPAAAALLVGLAQHGHPIAGTTLARLVGVAQGHATSAHLPRLAEMDLVVWEDGEPSPVNGRVPRVWSVTERGRKLAEVLTRGAVTP